MNILIIFLLGFLNGSVKVIAHQTAEVFNGMHKSQCHIYQMQ